MRTGHTLPTHSHIFRKEPPPVFSTWHTQLTTFHILLFCKKIWIHKKLPELSKNYFWNQTSYPSYEYLNSCACSRVAVIFLLSLAIITKKKSNVFVMMKKFIYMVFEFSVWQPFSSINHPYTLNTYDDSMHFTFQ